MNREIREKERNFQHSFLYVQNIHSSFNSILFKAKRKMACNETDVTMGQTDQRKKTESLSVRQSDIQSHDRQRGQTPICTCLYSVTNASNAVIFFFFLQNIDNLKDAHALSSSPTSAHAQWILLSTHQHLVQRNNLRISRHQVLVHFSYGFWYDSRLIFLNLERRPIKTRK